jgi:hypothetical protein
MANVSSDDGGKGEMQPGLQQALTDFAELLVGYADAVTNQLEAENQFDDSEAAKILRGALDIQGQSLLRYAMQEMASSTEELRREADRRTIDSGVSYMAAQSKTYVASARFARLGLIEIVEAIKKLLDMIWDIFGGAPGWFNDLINAINNLITMLSGLLGLRASSRAQQATKVMHTHLQQMYRTAAAQAERKLAMDRLAGAATSGASES